MATWASNMGWMVGLYCGGKRNIAQYSMLLGCRYDQFGMARGILASTHK